MQYVLRGDTPAGAKKTDKENSGASENEGGNEASTGDADGEDDPGTDDKSAEDDGTNGGEADAKEDKKTKKKKKKPLGPKVMKACQKKIPGLDSLLVKQYDFLDKSKPAKILLTFDIAIKHLVGSAPAGVPKPNPKEVAKQFLAKVKHKIKNRGKIKVAPGGLPDAVANAPDLGGGSANKLPPFEQAEP